MTKMTSKEILDCISKDEKIFAKKFNSADDIHLIIGTLL